VTTGRSRVLQAPPLSPRACPAGDEGRQEPRTGAVSWGVPVRYQVNRIYYLGE